MDPYNIKQKRKALDGICNEEGEAILVPTEIGIAIAGGWAPTFAARQVEFEDMQWFLPYAPSGAAKQNGSGQPGNSGR